MKKNNLFLLSQVLTFWALISGLTCSGSKKEITNAVVIKKNIASKIKLSFLSKDSIDVIFWNSETQISECQNDNLLLFVKNEKQLTEDLKTKVFNYYKSTYEIYKKGIGLNYMDITKEDLEKILPTPTTPENLFKSYKIGTIHIPSKKECAEGKIGLEFDCDWDIENGLGVKIENWEVKLVSIANDVYF